MRCLAALLLASCVDEPVTVAPYGGGAPAERLSELRLFADAPAQTPAPGVVPYDVIAPLWSDGAAKLRFVATPVPLATTADAWTIGAGTYLVKTFHFPRDARDPAAGTRLVETRVIAFTGGAPAMATYVWNDAQTDAFASGGNLDIDVDFIDASGAARHQVHHVPGTSQCDDCHRGGALGIRTPELAGQIDDLIAAGIADRVPDAIEPFVDPYDPAAPLAARASSYLDVNCAHCHSPGGAAQGTHADWRRAHVAEAICRDASYGVDGAERIIDPGHPERSVIVKRLRSSDAFVHMPRGPSHVIDERGVAMLESWISSLAGCP